MLEDKHGEQAYRLHDRVTGDVANGLLDVLFNKSPVPWVVELGLFGNVVGDV